MTVKKYMKTTMTESLNKQEIIELKAQAYDLIAVRARSQKELDHIIRKIDSAEQVRGAMIPGSPDVSGTEESDKGRESEGHTASNE